MTKYKMIHNPRIDQWQGIAVSAATWERPANVTVYGGSRSTYTAARESLGRAAAVHGLTLDSFQGEWSISDSGEEVQIVCAFVRGHTIAHGSQRGLTVQYAQIKNGATWVVATDRDGVRYDLLEVECRFDR